MPTPDPPTPDPDDDFADAAAPARWLLALAAQPGGVPLTQTGAIARAVVREGHDRYSERLSPGMHAFGPPTGEADVPWLGALHVGLKRLKLLRRRGKALLITARGREYLGDPHGLLAPLLGDYCAEPDEFTATIASQVLARLEQHPAITFDAIKRVAVDEARTRASERDVDTVLPGGASGNAASLAVADPAAWRSAFDKLAALQTLHPGWDGASAEAIDRRAIGRAEQLLIAFAQNGIPAPAVVPLPDGGVQIEWWRGERRLEIEVDSDLSIVFVCDDPHLPHGLDGELPQDGSIFQAALQRTFAGA